MNDFIIELIKNGYEIHLVPIKTTSGLHHPMSKTHMGITMLKRIPGIKRKGGSCYANGNVPWSYLDDPKAMTYVLADLKKRVDKIYKSENQNR